MLIKIYNELKMGKIIRHFLLVCLIVSIPVCSEAAIKLSGQENATTVTLLAGRSKLITFDEKISRASITEPDIADVVVVSPYEIVLNGKEAGTTTLIIWDEKELSTTFNLSIEIDTSQLQQLINQLVPFEDIYVYPAKNSIVLAGEVEKDTSIEKAVDLAVAFVSKETEVVNLLKLKEPKQIMLQVRFAEVDRTVSKQLGMDFLMQGANYTQGSFAGGVITPQLPATPEYAGPSSSTRSDISMPASTDLALEVRRGVDYTLLFKALEEKGLLRIIAEPNLLAKSGQEASFLAGGEFPIPVVGAAGGQSSGAVTIEFKEFGIKLNFTPDVTDSGTINLKVAPEVSVLDFSSAAVQLSGFTVPGLVTRRAETTVEMTSGESMIIGGLISQNETKAMNKVPLLGDIPVLGTLFQSEEFKKEETELVVIVTPQFVKPTQITELATNHALTETPDIVKPVKAPYRDTQADLLRGFIDPQTSIVRQTLDQVEQDSASSASYSQNPVPADPYYDPYEAYYESYQDYKEYQDYQNCEYK